MIYNAITSSIKYASWNLSLKSSSPSKPTVSAVSMTRDAPQRSRIEFEHGESSRSFADHDMPDFGNLFKEVRCPAQRRMDARRELLAQLKASEHTPLDRRRVKGVAQKRKKFPLSYEGVRPYQSSATRQTKVHKHAEVFEEPSLHKSRKGVERDVCSSSSSQTLRPAYDAGAFQLTYGSQQDAEVSFGHGTSKDLDALRQNTEVLPSILPQSVKHNEHHTALSREHKLVRCELEEKLRLLKDKDYCIEFLTACNADLQQKLEEQKSTLTSVRHELRSSQSQLDNVQRFISTADPHADKDIVHKLQQLNEEVYQISMTMADYVAEFARQSTTARQMKRRASIGGSILTTIGQVMVNRLSTAENDDIALLLHVAFQGYISHLLCQIVSSWTMDQRLNVLIERMYRRLRKAGKTEAETQAISGHWRSLTRAHILPTPISVSKLLVKSVIAELSDVTIATGITLPQHDIASKLSSVFGEKLLFVVSHAGTFRNMISEMISGDFEAFAIQSGEVFDEESMVDMNANQAAPQRTGATQTVLCASRVGLKKRREEQIIMLIKAQVVLESFVG